jgi:hypothetical protein
MNEINEEKRLIIKGGKTIEKNSRIEQKNYN